MIVEKYFKVNYTDRFNVGRITRPGEIYRFNVCFDGLAVALHVIVMGCVIYLIELLAR